MAPVIEVTRDSLLARRSAILARLDLSESEFWAVNATRTLSSDEWEAKEELEEIEFLLGDVAS
ncbi:hypothetical protein [Herbiconiux daphne]|uniref:Uncharacterized protein n=1 Tax=Herbiconiux daphne TaxID=2970914 RepID=A0ABT2GWU3_9MICO|nr:hypothetical protein [Herbiconiux daphne]MCS5732388.1 hypothetical protein [Herbiconiux daphne]